MWTQFDRHRRRGRRSCGQDGSGKTQRPGEGRFAWYTWCVALVARLRRLGLIRTHLAEEGGAGKVFMIERGGYKDMDACVMCAVSSC